MSFVASVFTDDGLLLEELVAFSWLPLGPLALTDVGGSGGTGLATAPALVAAEAALTAPASVGGGDDVSAPSSSAPFVSKSTASSVTADAQAAAAGSAVAAASKETNKS